MPPLSPIEFAAKVYDLELDDERWMREVETFVGDWLRADRTPQLERPPDAGGRAQDAVQSGSPSGGSGTRLSTRGREMVAHHITAAVRLRHCFGGFAADVWPQRATEPAAHVGLGGVGRKKSLRARMRDMIVCHDLIEDGEGVPADLAPSFWAAVGSGDWSLIDRFEREDRFWLVAYRHETDSKDPRCLAARERDVVELAARGETNRRIGMALGIAVGTVAGQLSRALAKLGLSDRTDLVRSWAIQQEEQMFCIRVRQAELLVSVRPLPNLAEVPSAESLTPSEQAVAELVVAGYSNARVAQERGVSERTVANQVASVFRKLNVHSRAELASWVVGARRRHG